MQSMSDACWNDLLERVDREGYRHMTHKRKDSNHNAITETMRACGALVIDCTLAPELGFDAIAIKHGRVAFLEIKDGSLPPSRRTLTDNEIARRFQITAHDGEYIVMLDMEQAQAWCERAAIDALGSPTTHEKRERVAPSACVEDKRE